MLCATRSKPANIKKEKKEKEKEKENMLLTIENGGGRVVSEKTK